MNQYIIKARAELTGRPVLLDECYLDAMMDATEIDQVAKPQAISLPGGKEMEGTSGVVMKGVHAIVPIHGPISSYESFWQMLFGGTSYDTIIKDLEAVGADRRIKNVILHVDSPGGQVDGVTDAEAAVHALKKRGKNVITYSSGMNCSAAYWVSSAADHMIASPTSIIGSVGVIARVPKKEDDFYKVYRSANAKNKAKQDNMQETINEIESVFHSAVVANRKVTLDTIKSTWGEGRAYAAAIAQKIRMIDTITKFRDIVP